MTEKNKIIDRVSSLYILKEQVNRFIDHTALIIEGESWQDIERVEKNLSICKEKLQLMITRIDDVLESDLANAFPRQGGKL